MNRESIDTGICAPHIEGGVVVTQDVFQQRIDCAGKNIELSVKNGTFDECITTTVGMCGGKPIVSYKVELTDDGPEFTGGEIRWSDNPVYITENGVFGIFEGKVFSFLFSEMVRNRVADFIHEYYDKYTSDRIKQEIEWRHKGILK